MNFKTLIYPNIRYRTPAVPAAVCLLLAAVAPTTLQAQTSGGTYFSDNFEGAANVSPYTIAQMSNNNSLATLSTPGPAQVGSWLTYDQADGGPLLFGVQVTDAVDEPGQSYTNTYQGSNVLRIYRAGAAGGSAIIANFATAQTGGIVRATWLNMVAYSPYPYSEMIHITTASSGGEGGANALLSLGLSGEGTAAFYAGGWDSVPGITNDRAFTWQHYQLDVDLDHSNFNLTIDGNSSGWVSSFAPLAPGNTFGGMAFRGGSSFDDLFYIDDLQVYSIPKHVYVTSAIVSGETILTNVPVVFTVNNGVTLTNALMAASNSIQLLVNGENVTPQITAVSNGFTVTYLPAAGWPPLSSNTVTLIAGDTEVPPVFTTNTVGFNVLEGVGQLAVFRFGNELTMSWPGSGYVLQVNDNLANSAGWVDIAGGEVSPVTLPMDEVQKFYRLRPGAIACDCCTLQAAIDAKSAAGGGTVSIPAGRTINCNSYVNEIEPDIQSKQSILVRENVMLNLNGSTIDVDPTETAKGISLCSHSGVENGEVDVIAFASGASQSIFNSAISVGAANGEGGTVAQPSYFEQITDWKIQNIKVSQPFACASIEVMSGSNHGLVSNVTILPSTNAVNGVGFDWGNVGYLTTADAQIPAMIQEWQDGQMYSTHPHDVVIDTVFIGPLLAAVNDDDSAAIRTSACYNFQIRNVTVYGAQVGVAMHAGDCGFEFSLPPDRQNAHAGYVVSNFTLMNIRSKGVIVDGLSDNVWRSMLNYGAQPPLNPYYPGIIGEIVCNGTISGTSASGSFGIESQANTSCIYSNLFVQNFDSDASFASWIGSSTLEACTITNSRSSGIVIGLSAPATGYVPPTNVLITTSTIVRNGVATHGSAGVSIALSTNVTVTGNIIGAATGTETQFYGIYVDNQAVNPQITVNTFGKTDHGGSPFYIEP